METDGVGMWYPTVPNHETTILIIIALSCGFISMAILTEHIWRDKSTTYALDRQILVIPGYRPLYTSSDILLNRTTIDIEEVEQYRKRTTRHSLK